MQIEHLDTQICSARRHDLRFQPIDCDLGYAVAVHEFSVYKLPLPLDTNEHVQVAQIPTTQKNGMFQLSRRTCPDDFPLVVDRMLEKIIKSWYLVEKDLVS